MVYPFGAAEAVIVQACSGTRPVPKRPIRVIRPPTVSDPRDTPSSREVGQPCRRYPRAGGTTFSLPRSYGAQHQDERGRCDEQNRASAEAESPPLPEVIDRPGRSGSAPHSRRRGLRDSRYDQHARHLRPHRQLRIVVDDAALPRPLILRLTRLDAVPNPDRRVEKPTARSLWPGLESSAHQDVSA
jgi:hypothetical protein